MSLWVLFQHSLSFICVDHLVGTSVAPFNARFFSRDLASVPFCPHLLKDVPPEAADIDSCVLSCSIIFFTGEKKWSLPSVVAHIKILPLGNFYEDKILTWDF